MIPLARLSIIGASAVVLLGLTTEPWRHLQNDDTDVDRRECPGPWLRLPFRIQQPGSVKVAGFISKVPEFHDCQRFIGPTRHYGALYAVFASYRLDALEARLADVTTNAGAPTPFLAAAEIVTKKEYPPLG